MEDVPSLVANKIREEKDGLVRLVADYSPCLAHSRSFCYFTKDRNPIHQEHPEYREAVSPGFLQTAVALKLIKDVMKSININPTDYPFSSTHIEMKGFVLTGLDCMLEVELINPKNGLIESSAKLSEKDGGVLFDLKRIDFRHEFNLPVFEPDASQITHTSLFTGEKIKEFSELIGSESPESNLYAVSGSSSVVFDALDSNKLKFPPKDVLAVYSSQKIYADSSATLDLKKGISLELYLLNQEKFGKLSEKDETLLMYVLAKDKRCRFIYLSHSLLSFQAARLLDVAMRRKLRRKVNKI